MVLRLLQFLNLNEALPGAHSSGVNQSLTSDRLIITSLHKPSLYICIYFPYSSLLMI